MLGLGILRAKHSPTLEKCLANSLAISFVFVISIFSIFRHSTMSFLGGLSLHLNHLIGSRVTIGHFGHFLLDFLAQIWTQGHLRHILGPILVIFEICQFLAIPGPFEYFSENGWSQKIKVFSMKERSLPPLSV